MGFYFLAKSAKTSESFNSMFYTLKSLDGVISKQVQAVLKNTQLFHCPTSHEHALVDKHHNNRVSFCLTNQWSQWTSENSVAHAQHGLVMQVTF